MFILTTESQLTKAINKARTVKPRLKAHRLGVYTVTGSKGDAYTVNCYRDAQGRKVVACECTGAQRGLVCYHAASAIGLHIVLAADVHHPLRRATA